jgi:tetratricopeptide (TPR) repeat protein
VRRPTTCLLLLLCLLGSGLTGCRRIQARSELKQGNALYEGESYREALGHYQKGLELDPSATFAWRSLGFSAVALYRPGDPDPENREFAEMAIDAFQKYLRAFPGDEKVKEYLLTTLINSEQYDRALELLKAQARAHPEKPEINQAIVSVLIKGGRLDEAFSWAQSPEGKPDPQVFYSLGVACWDRAAHDLTLDREAGNAMADLGLKATARAIELEPDYAEAMAYHNLLLREKGRLEPDPFKQQDWIAQAEEWRDKAIALIEAQKKPAPAPGAAR